MRVIKDIVFAVGLLLAATVNAQNQSGIITYEGAFLGKNRDAVGSGGSWPDSFTIPGGKILFRIKVINAHPNFSFSSGEILTTLLQRNFISSLSTTCFY